MKQYLALMHLVRSHGTPKEDRTGINTLSIFGYHMRFDLRHGFPLVTTKRCHLPSIIYELLWFLNGDTNLTYLHQHNVSIWDAWADHDGNLGPIYGRQWRAWETSDGRHIDQLAELVQQLKKNPHSRRLLISTWNVGQLDKMALVPCHVLFQFYIVNGLLSCQIYQRSCDIFLGLPFNLASYALLMHLLAQQCDLQVKDLIWTGGDTHLYNNHLYQADQQLIRQPRSLPQLIIKRRPASLFEYCFEDFQIIGYNPYPVIKAPVAI